MEGKPGFLLKCREKVIEYGRKTAGFFQKLPYRTTSFRATAAVLIFAILFTAVLLLASRCSGRGTTIGSSGNGGVSDSAYQSGSSGVDGQEMVSDLIASDIKLPEKANTGKKYKLSDTEAARLREMVVYLERNGNFDPGTLDFNQMALAGARKAVEKNDVRQAEGRQSIYMIHRLVMQSNVMSIFGRALKTTDLLNGPVGYTGGSYYYADPAPGPKKAAASIGQAYSLGDNFYRVEAVVSRGRASEPGRYSKKLSVLLLKDSRSFYGYFVVGLENSPTSYVSMNVLEQPESSSPSLPPAPASSAPETSSAVSSDVSSTASVPDTGSSGASVTLTELQSSGILQLLQSLPPEAVSFEPGDDREAYMALYANRVRCRTEGVDDTKEAAEHTKEVLEPIAKGIFGTGFSDSGTVFTDGVYHASIYSNKNIFVYQIDAAYDLGEGYLKLTCSVKSYPGSTDQPVNGSYAYTAVLKQDAAAAYGYYLTAQSYTKDQ